MVAELRIVLFAADYGVGGAQNQLQQVARGLRELGHSVRLVSLFPGQAIKSESPQPLLGASRGVAGIHDVLRLAPTRLHEAVSRCKGDVVYSQLYRANVVAGLYAGISGAAPWVCGIRSGVARVGPSRALWRKGNALLSNRAAAVLANSHSGLLEHGGVGFDISKGMVIRNGVDLRMFTIDNDAGNGMKRSLECPEDAVLVGCVGRLDPVKDHKTFLRACATARGLTRRRLRVLCVGDGPPRRQSALKNVARRLGLERMISFVSHCDDMPALYNALDVLCLASRSEGCPNALLEAMACGVSCVSTDVGDARQILGGLGTVVGIGAHHAMGPAIAHAAGLQTEAHAWRRRRHVSTLYSAERAHRATSTLFIELVELNRNRVDNSIRQ